MSNLIDQDKAVESVENIVCSMSVCMSLEECKGMKRMQKRVIEVLTELPSAQPEPHYCRECKWSRCHINVDKYGNTETYWHCLNWDGGTDEEGYCHEWERRTDGN